LISSEKTGKNAANDENFVCRKQSGVARLHQRTAEEQTEEKNPPEVKAAVRPEEPMRTIQDGVKKKARAL